MDDSYHGQCPLCDVNLLGFTDADMVQHFVDEHPDHGYQLGRKLSIDPNKMKRCNDCKKEYVNLMGECPFCYHQGPPYK
jgi:predicted DCC family thiol-disulfide oxidoreductase YuxK